MRSDLCAEHNWSPRAMARSGSPILESKAKTVFQERSRAIWKSIQPCIWEMLTVNPCELRITVASHLNTREKNYAGVWRIRRSPIPSHPSKAPRQHARSRGHTLSRPALCRLWNPSALIRFRDNTFSTLCQAAAHVKQSLENRHNLYLINEIPQKTKQTIKI